MLSPGARFGALFYVAAQPLERLPTALAGLATEGAPEANVEPNLRIQYQELARLAESLRVCFADGIRPARSR